MDLSGLWYHGDAKGTDFSSKVMDVEDYSRDRNALGPGIYFTRNRVLASGYAQDHGNGAVYTAEMLLKPKRVMTVKHKPTAAIVEKFIRLAPRESRETGLSNWGPGPNAMRRAVAGYVDQVELLDALCGVYNDFYQRNSKAYAKAMVAVGFDAYYHVLPEDVHLVVWNPDIIQVIETSNEQYIMKHIKNFDQLSESIKTFDKKKAAQFLDKLTKVVRVATPEQRAVVDDFQSGTEYFFLLYLPDDDITAASIDRTLQVMVNNVEGDASQLDDKHAEYARKKGWLDDSTNESGRQ